MLTTHSPRGSYTATTATTTTAAAAMAASHRRLPSGPSAFVGSSLSPQSGGAGHHQFRSGASPLASGGAGNSLARAIHNMDAAAAAVHGDAVPPPPEGANPDSGKTAAQLIAELKRTYEVVAAANAAAVAAAAAAHEAAAAGLSAPLGGAASASAADVAAAAGLGDLPPGILMTALGSSGAGRYGSGGGGSGRTTAASSPRVARMLKMAATGLHSPFESSSIALKGAGGGAAAAAATGAGTASSTALEVESIFTVKTAAAAAAAAGAGSTGDNPFVTAAKTSPYNTPPSAAALARLDVRDRWVAAEAAAAEAVEAAVKAAARREELTAALWRLVQGKDSDAVSALTALTA